MKGHRDELSKNIWSRLAGEEGCVRKQWCLRWQVFLCAVRGTFTGRHGHCQRLQAVLIFGLVNLSWAAHTEGEHFSEGIRFLLNVTKQFSEQLDTSRGNISLGNKHMIIICGISSLSRSTSAWTKCKMQKDWPCVSPRASYGHCPNPGSLLCSSLNWLCNSDSLHPCGQAWQLACPVLCLFTKCFWSFLYIKRAPILWSEVSFYVSSK